MSSAVSMPATALPVQLGASAIAGFTAAAFSLPFDLMKSRLQSKNQYKGVLDVFTQTLKKVLSFVETYGYELYILFM